MLNRNVALICGSLPAVPRLNHQENSLCYAINGHSAIYPLIRATARHIVRGNQGRLPKAEISKGSNMSKMIPNTCRFTAVLVVCLFSMLTAGRGLAQQAITRCRREAKEQ
jgi:hypothetical protein